MPALEMAQDSGRLLAWRKREGDVVSKGEPLMEVETDKAVVEVEAEADGVLAGVRASAGEAIPVGHTIAWILAPGETVPSEGARPRAGPKGAEPVPAPDSTAAPATPSAAPAGRPLASPKARRLAAERGIDLRNLSGSAPDGAVRAADVMSREAPSLEQPPAMWRIMADRVTQSWVSVPQFYVSREVDAAALVDLRKRLASRAEAGAPGVTYTDLLVALVARALMGHARLNASWTAEGIRHHAASNVGIATALDQGVVVPVIHGADQLSVFDIAKRRRELVDRARTGRLRPADLAGGTFTISNLGTHEVQAFSAIVYAPQAAILAIGRIADRVVAREGRPAVRPVMTLTLTCDHRVADGARAAAFLNDLARSIEAPENLNP